MLRQPSLPQVLAAVSNYPSHPSTLSQWADFLEARRDGIYSTDSPAILGLSKWGTPRSVWLEKVEPAEAPRPMSLQAFLGLELEATLAKLWHERYPDLPDPIPIRDTLTHPAIPWLKSHMDYQTDADGGLLLLECKTRMRRSAAWGEDGSSKVPVDIWVQVQHELLVAGAQMAHVIVLFGLHTFQVHPIARDPDFLAALVPKLDTFWHVNVLEGIPPALTGSAVDYELSKREQTEPGLRAATPEQDRFLRRLQRATLNVSQAGLAKAELENQLREMIGEAEGITGAAGTVTYRKNKDGVKVGWEVVAKSYKAMVHQLLELAAPGDDDLLVAQLAAIQASLPVVEGLFTIVTAGARVLRPTFTEDTDDE